MQGTYERQTLIETTKYFILADSSVYNTNFLVQQKFNNQKIYYN